MRLKPRIKRGLMLFAAIALLLAVSLAIKNNTTTKPTFLMDGTIYVMEAAIEEEIDLLSIEPWFLVDREVIGLPKENCQAYGIRQNTQIYYLIPGEMLLLDKENSGQNQKKQLYLSATKDSDLLLALYWDDGIWYYCLPK